MEFKAYCLKHPTVNTRPNKIYNCKSENGFYKWYDDSGSWDYYMGNSKERFLDFFKIINTYLFY